MNIIHMKLKLSNATGFVRGLAVNSLIKSSQTIEIARDDFINISELYLIVLKR